MLLGRFKIFHSNDIDEIEQFVRTAAAGNVKNARSIAGDQGFQCNAVAFDRFSIFSLSSDVSAKIDFDGADYLRLVFQTRCHSRVAFGSIQLDVTPADAGYLLPVGLPAQELHPDGYRSLAVRIDPDSLRRRLSALCGTDIQGSIEFDQPQKGDQRFAEFIRRPLFAAARELDTVGPVFQEHLMSDLEAITVTRLLLLAAHSQSKLLDRAETAPGSSQMRRAEEFIALHWNRAIDVEGIAQASGVSARTILRHFHEKHGETPRAYLRRLRLENARQMLLSAQETDSVVAIALKCGFSSLGHFAESYRRKFGELPSATLKGMRPNRE